MYAEMSIQEMSKLPGISDLNTAAKVKFIKALKAEEAGNHMEAEALLNEAIEREQNPMAGMKGVA